jgi:hypothetical protein
MGIGFGGIIGTFLLLHAVYVGRRGVRNFREWFDNS